MGVLSIARMSVDIFPSINIPVDSLYARGLSPQDVVSAMLAQNRVVTPGSTKMGPIEYDVEKSTAARRCSTS